MTEDSGNTDETLVNLLREERDNWRRLAELRQESVDRLRSERDHWKRIADDRYIASNALIERARKAEAGLVASSKMHEALIRARDKFREYTVSHRNKNTADGDAKAHTNAEMGMVCDNAIHAWERYRG